jgi:hypothetical protein
MADLAPDDTRDHDRNKRLATGVRISGFTPSKRRQALRLGHDLLVRRKVSVGIMHIRDF